MAFCTGHIISEHRIKRGGEENEEEGNGSIMSFERGAVIKVQLVHLFHALICLRRSPLFPYTGDFTRNAYFVFHQFVNVFA